MENLEHTSGGITIAVATICFDGFGDQDFQPTFDHAAELGVSDIEFNCWYPRNLTPSGLTSINDRCKTHGLRAAALQILSPAPAPRHPGSSAEVARWMGLFDAAERLGVRVIKTTGTTRDDGTDLSRIIEVLKVVAPIAADRGLTIALENHFSNTFEFAEDYRRVFRAIDTSSVGMCLDTGHFAASGVDIMEIIDEFSHRIVHVDLKDCARSGEDRFVPFGEGIVDFDRSLDALVQRAYRGFVVIEYPRSDHAHMTEHLQAGLAIAQRHVEVSA
jgi:sugar phosphate isomerase/epimerase